MTSLAYGQLTDEALSQLSDILGAERVLTTPQARFQRASVPAPFPLHRAAEYMPDAVVLPETTAEVQAIVRWANRHRIPLVPRCGGTGLADGAVPLRHGVVVDTKRMNRFLELDLENRTCTIQPAINMLKLNEEYLLPHGLFYPDDPASYPVSIIGGRIGTGGWSLLGARYGHVPDNVLSLELVLGNGEILRVGGGGGKKIRKSSTGYRLKDLFIGHQGTLGITTECTLELYAQPEAVFPAFFLYRDFETAWRAAKRFSECGVATLAGVVLFDEQKVEFLRRDDEAWIPLPTWVRTAVCVVAYGLEREVEVAREVFLTLGRETSGVYAGRELSEGDWASRHDRYATPLHGRRKDGQVVRMSWHCEDAALNWSELAEVREKWHEIVRRLVDRYEIFDDWGMFFYSNSPFRGWGDYLVEIDVGIQEELIDEETWQAWCAAKREIAAVALEHGGSITAAHGATRAGEVELVPVELGYGFELMKIIKRWADPNNIMNPGKYELDRAYVWEAENV